MNKTIEEIWRDGFLKEERLYVPRVTDLYNQKSMLVTETIIKKLQIEVWSLIPIAAVLFIVNLTFGNDNFLFWGAVSAIPCLVWFFIGMGNVRSLENIQHGISCYEYLISIRQKLREIAAFERKLSLYTVLVMLLPMLVYTYLNNLDKTLGQVLGVEVIDWPIRTIFLLLPVIFVLTLGVMRLLEDVSYSRYHEELDALIRDIDALRD